MKKHGILNSEIAKVLADLGHTDQIMIGDAGLPVPFGVKKIDLSLILGEPSFIDVLKLVKEEMLVEKYILAEEIKQQNLSQLSNIEGLFSNEDVKCEFVFHDALKKQSEDVKAIIRTGENTPYSNIILQSACLF